MGLPVALRIQPHSLRFAVAGETSHASLMHLVSSEVSAIRPGIGPIFIIQCKRVNVITVRQSEI
jgi:hypothetical protein